MRDRCETVAKLRSALSGIHEGAVKGFLDFDAWVGWIRSLNDAWLFLVILAFVVSVVGLWSRSLRLDKTGESEEDGSRS